MESLEETLAGYSETDYDNVIQYSIVHIKTIEDVKDYMYHINKIESILKKKGYRISNLLTKTPSTTIKFTIGVSEYILMKRFMTYLLIITITGAMFTAIIIYIIK